MRCRFDRRCVLALALILAGGACAAQPVENYELRQAVTALDMLAKVRKVCPDTGDETARLREMEQVAQRRFQVSAKALWRTLSLRDPALLMTSLQARHVVAGAGGCDSPRLAQWRGGTQWLVDISTQVLAGEAPADRVWPRQPALERPIRILVPGQEKDKDSSALRMLLVNSGPAPVRVALLGSQLFVGLCTRLASPSVPVVQGYVPTLWLDIPARASMPATLVRDSSCKDEPHVSVGGTMAIDMGQGVRYWRFLLRGVGQAPASRRPPAGDDSTTQPGG